MLFFVTFVIFLGALLAGRLRALRLRNAARGARGPADLIRREDRGPFAVLSDFVESIRLLTTFQQEVAVRER
jgi:hypothetical protein